MEWQIILLAFLTLFASIVGTLTGFGTSTVMVPILVLFFPPLETLLFVGIIHLFGDVWKMLLFRTGLNGRLIFLFGVPSVLFSFFGSSLSLSISPEILLRVLGVALIGYVFFLLKKHTLPLNNTRNAALLGGALSGFFAGVFGIGGAIRGAFLDGFNLKKATYLFTAGIIAFVTDVTRISNYVLEGTYLAPMFIYGMVVFIPLTFIGAKIAQKLLTHVPEKQFSLLIAIFLFLIGVKLLFVP